MDKPDKSSYTPIDFEQWHETGILDLTPKFQRRGVWKLAARSFFIDTLLRGMPVPPIYMRVIQRPDRKGIIREVIDGQQRLAAVLDYMGGKYRLSPSLKTTWGGKTYDDLTQEEQRAISTFSFSAEVFQAISDEDVLRIFERLNTYSVPLNSQELRNGKYFGPFKQTAYDLAREHLAFWRKHRIFTEQSIARMLEVELTSELMIAQIAGMQPGKSTIDKYYGTYDEDLPGAEQLAKRFRRTIDVISEAVTDTIANGEFRRPPLFYTLFCTVFHRLYGLSGTKLPETPKKALSRDEALGLREAVEELSDLVAQARADESVPERYLPFVTACRVHTDDLIPRQTRLLFLYKKAF